MSTVYYTATTLDGYLADEEDSLHWLFKQDQDEDGALSYAEFIADVGAVCMGSTTYEWVLPHLTDGWAVRAAVWVFTTRELPTVEGDVRFVRGDVRPSTRRWWPPRTARTSGSSGAGTSRRSSPRPACWTGCC